MESTRNSKQGDSDSLDQPESASSTTGQGDSSNSGDSMGESKQAASDINGGRSTSDGLDQSEQGSVDQADYDKMVKAQFWIKDIIRVLSEAGINWDIRPAGYDEAYDSEDIVPEYLEQIVDMDVFTDKVLNFWRLGLERASRNAIRVSLIPRASQLHHLESQAVTPQMAIINIVWRYLNEIGTERLQ
ncbi:hypothetical protein LCGC14_1579280 [marine sediment metagenome]|uniref:Uncharacterized protein n=1 Tax=marine sediment metagenome TaxID=412755 RepID=A0A0F9IHI3_9ZZZZ